MKNHQAQPTGSNVMLIAHATNSSSCEQQLNYHDYGNGKKPQPWTQGQHSRNLAKGGNSTPKGIPLPLRPLTSRTREKLLFNRFH
ncbi:hypothetical protein TB1_034114 [Malus domestica]